METQSSARIINFSVKYIAFTFLKQESLTVCGTRTRHCCEICWSRAGADKPRVALIAGSEWCVTGVRQCSGCILNPTYIDLTFYLPNFADSLSKKKFA